VQLADLGRDAGYCPASEASGRARIGDDRVTELDSLGGSSHPSYRRRRVQVISQERRVGAFPTSAGVTHEHGVRDQHVVVHLGIAGPGRRVAGGRPDEPTGGNACLGASPPTSSFCDETVQVLEGGVTLGVDDLVHVLGATDHAQLGDRLMRRDDELQAGTQTAHEALACAGVMRTTYAEDGPVVSEVHFTGQAEQTAS
jgi:hypothetical protein